MFSSYMSLIPWDCVQACLAVLRSWNCCHWCDKTQISRSNHLLSGVLPTDGGVCRVVLWPVSVESAVLPSSGILSIWWCVLCVLCCDELCGMLDTVCGVYCAVVLCAMMLCAVYYNAMWCVFVVVQCAIVAV
jgi:hypothetical protein